MFKLYTDDNKSKYSSNPKDMFKSTKKFMNNSASTKEDT